MKKISIKWQLVLVLLLIGWESGESFFNQSESDETKTLNQSRGNGYLLTVRGQTADGSWFGQMVNRIWDW